MDVSGALNELLSVREILRHPSRRVHVARGLGRAFALGKSNELLFSLVFPAPRVPGSDEEDREIVRRLVALFEADWRNVEEGIYPASVAGFSWSALARALPRLAADAPRVRRRAQKHIHDELPAEARVYPKYYQRNFHFQSEGYLGLGSAARYDAQVEILFGGTADAMRRQVIPPVVRALGGADPAHLRVLDIACGTGGLLRMMARALPGVHLYGIDLSPHYIARARQVLGEVTPVSLLCENAEQLPFPEGWFDAVTCVYLMHELPADVRSRVIVEASRVLRPGGLFVLADSIQAGDAPALEARLEHFPRQFHEPYYKHYLRDDLERRMRSAGLEPRRVEQAMVTKIFTAVRQLHS